MYRPQLRGLGVSVTVNEPLYSNPAACGRLGALATPPHFFNTDGAWVDLYKTAIAIRWEAEQQLLVRVARETAKGR